METNINIPTEQLSLPITSAIKDQSESASQQKQTWRTMLVGVGIGLCVALILVFAIDASSFPLGSPGEPGDLGGLEAGITAPNFTATDLEGNSVQLSDYLGKPVMLTFWSPECPMCVKEMPVLQAIATDSALDVALVTVTGGVSMDTLKDFVEEHEITFSILVTEDKEIAEAYQTQYVPFSYFINADGTIAENMSPDRAHGKELHKELITWLEECNNTVGCAQK